MPAAVAAAAVAAAAELQLQQSQIQSHKNSHTQSRQHVQVHIAFGPKILSSAAATSGAAVMLFSSSNHSQRDTKVCHHPSCQDLTHPPHILHNPPLFASWLSLFVPQICHLCCLAILADWVWPGSNRNNKLCNSLQEA